VRANPYSRKALSRWLVTVPLWWGSLRREGRTEDRLGRKNIFGPSFHQRTVSVGFTVCGFEWPAETPAVPRPIFSRTPNHKKYVNPKQNAPDRTPFVLPGASLDGFPRTSQFAPPEKGL